MKRKKKEKKIRVAAFLCLLLVLLARADTGQLYTSDKLSSSLINCIVQDRKGLIWVGTEYGLSRFDGYHFVNYLHDEKDTTSIADNTISDFLVDRSGQLWIGSAKGLMRYDYSHNFFIRYSFPDGRRPRIYSLIQNHQGDLLIGTAGFGLYAIPKGSNKIVKQSEYARKDSDLFFTHIYEDDRGILWQASHLSVFTRYIKKGKRVSAKDFNSPAGAPVAFYQPRRNMLLIICMFGIETYDYTTGKLSDAGFDFGPYKGNVTINSAMLDHKGTLYLGTSECGVLMANWGERTLKPLHLTDKDRFDLSASYVTDLMEDKDQNIWVGCYKKGLYLINNEKTAFHSWSFSNQNYSIGSSVSSIASGDRGETWCTVQNSGVFGFDPEGKIVHHPQSPSGTSIIYRDRTGKFWIGTGKALYQYDPTTGASTQKLTFTSAGIYCITDDGKGKLYLSIYSKGLYIYDTHTGKVNILNMSQRSPHGHLCNDWIRAMTFDHQGLLWIGTSNGVSCLDPKTLRFDAFGWNSILRNVQANSLCEDEDGNLLIGTDEGLWLYSVKNNQTTLFPHAEILRDKQICGIVRDHNNDIWVSTTMGIWQYNHREGVFIGHINGNGLTAHEYVRGAVLHREDDFIGFGIADGITTFYPEEVNKNSMKMGKVYLTNFIVDGKSMDCQQNHFKIPYSQNSFTLEFSLLTYKNTDDISFQYRINNGKWLATREGVNAIPFTKLEPGKYLIEVRAANNGILSSGMKTLTVIVQNPWYASSWAFIFYITAFGCLLIFFIRTYERKRKADLDEQKMRFLIDATHDIRSPLTLIMGPLDKLKKRIHDREDLGELDTIDRNAQRLLLLVNQILDERRIDKNQMKLHCQETDMVEFTRNICSLYQYNADERKIQFRVSSMQPEIHVWIDRINFDKVVSNLLSNAFKYTFDGGEIDVVLWKDNQNMHLRVLDNGMGFKDEKPEKLFERFYQGRNSNDLHIEGTGIGLNLCRAIVQMHGGKITAHNREDGKRGACLDIQIPLGKNHLSPEEIDLEKETETDTHPGRKKQHSKNFNLLIVDDDPEIAHYITSELGEWYHFDSARNGAEALKKLLTGNFDLVISDVMMPEMDGIELLKRIKNNPNISDIPVILLTSKSEVSNRLEGLKKGADAFLAKPFNMEELHILIDNLVNTVRRLRGKFSGAWKQEEKLEKVEVKGNNDALMERIMKCVNENLSNPGFNVEKLTEEVGISRAQLHRKMKEITGISTGEFIRNLRLEQAAHLIQAGTVNVTQVAYAVGFNNQTHFSTVFKKHFGMTPTEYYETHHHPSSFPETESNK